MSEAVIKLIGRAKDVFFSDAWSAYAHEKHLLNKPFFFEGKNKSAVLLIHGWTSMPYSMRRFGSYLHKKGYTVYAPLLSGHGTTPKDLEHIRWKEWLRDVVTAYDKLKNQYDTVYVGGISVGGSLSLLLAKERSDVAGIFLLGTPYRMRLEKLGYLYLQYSSFFQRYRKKVYFPVWGESYAAMRSLTYHQYPIKNAMQAMRLIMESRYALHCVTQPIFLLQADRDLLIHKNSLEEIYLRVSSKIKKKKVVARAYHTFIENSRQNHLYDEIFDFLQSLQKK